MPSYKSVSVRAVKIGVRQSLTSEPVLRCGFVDCCPLGTATALLLHTIQYMTLITMSQLALLTNININRGNIHIALYMIALYMYPYEKVVEKTCLDMYC